MGDLISIQAGAQSSPQPKQAIVLAGGLGTRLRSVVSELPKCMAPVAGRPFLFYVINYLRLQGVEHFIFSLGYKHEVIEAYLAAEFSTLSYQCAVESEPLGTGGAISMACGLATEKNVLVVNGDTLFRIDAQQAFDFHHRRNADCTLVLKPMQHFDRYGVVEMNRHNRIVAFREKQFYDKGLINGGVYILNVEKFLQIEFPAVFSFEKDYLQHLHTGHDIYGITQDAYFIDIGIPGDFERAQTELAQPPFSAGAIDKEWTLFLDRDGVLNHDKVGSYIFTPGEFRFYEGVPVAIRLLRQKFGRLIIATNQRGVGRGLMSVADLDAVHHKMKLGLEAEGATPDAIFYASAVDNNDPLRKPNPGMATLAKKQFPDIDFTRSVMVGNNLSDMQFGRNAGMYCVFLTTTQEIQLPHPDIDLSFNSLPDFVKAL